MEVRRSFRIFLPSNRQVVTVVSGIAISGFRCGRFSVNFPLPVQELQVGVWYCHVIVLKIVVSRLNDMCICGLNFVTNKHIFS